MYTVRYLLIAVFGLYFLIFIKFFSASKFQADSILSYIGWGHSIYCQTNFPDKIDTSKMIAWGHFNLWHKPPRKECQINLC